MRAGSHSVLIAAQAAGALIGASAVMGLAPQAAQAQPFVYAAVIGFLVWAIGWAGSFILKIVRRPTPLSLVVTVFAALAAAAAAGPALGASLSPLVLAMAAPLAGALAGYFLVR